MDPAPLWPELFLSAVLAKREKNGKNRKKETDSRFIALPMGDLAA